MFDFGPLYFILLGILVITFVGIIVYVKFFSPGAKSGQTDRSQEHAREKSAGNNDKKPKKQKRGQAAQPRQAQEVILPSEKMIDVADFHGNHIVTTMGTVVALLYVEPVLASTTSSPDGLMQAFMRIVHTMEDDVTFQVVQMPLPARIEGLTDRYAMATHHWKQVALEANRNQDEWGERTSMNRFKAAHKTGEMILELGGSTPHRESFVALSRPASAFGAPTQSAIDEASRKLGTDVKRLTALFANNNITLSSMPPEYAIEILWYAYNPDRGASAFLPVARARYLDIIENGGIISKNRGTQKEGEPLLIFVISR